MESVAQSLRGKLEARGEYVARANSGTGWFAVNPRTWKNRIALAARLGREGPSLVVYRTRSDDPRDHYVIPYSVVRGVLVESTLTFSNVHQRYRWDLTLKNGLLHVTHSKGSIDVSKYHRRALVAEEAEDWILPEEISASLPYREGLAQQIYVNRYERNQAARAACLRHYGTSCVICGFDFGTTFGSPGEGYIHVHHTRPLADIGEEYEVDPVADLRPVCPNCHAFIHLGGELRSIEEVTQLVAARRRDGRRH
jgi:hypothetical protein